MTTYTKTMKVIDSCKTRSQLITAHTYFRLALKYMNTGETWCAYDLLKIKTEELL